LFFFLWTIKGIYLSAFTNNLATCWWLLRPLPERRPPGASDWWPVAGVEWPQQGNQLGQAHATSSGKSWENGDQDCDWDIK